MTRDELEFSISQYLDGTLVEREKVALERRLENDGEARALLAEYRRVDAALKGVSAAAPLPAVNWAGLSAEISAAVAGERTPAAPARSFRIADWIRTAPAKLAVAASALLAVGVAAVVVLRGGPDRGETTGPTQQVAVI